MSSESSIIFQRLWYYCNVMRDEGVSYRAHTVRMNRAHAVRMIRAHAVRMIRAHTVRMIRAHAVRPYCIS